eukprot:COSAG02_NODE_1519_length_12168_cov_5.127682_9_plen_111_part_00
MKFLIWTESVLKLSAPQWSGKQQLHRCVSDLVACARLLDVEFGYARPLASIMPGQTWRDNGHKALCPLCLMPVISVILFGHRCDTSVSDSRRVVTNTSLVPCMPIIKCDQ